MRQIGYDVGELEYEEIEDDEVQFDAEMKLTDELSKLIATEIDKEILDSMKNMAIPTAIEIQQIKKIQKIIGQK